MRFRIALCLSALIGQLVGTAFFAPAALAAPGGVVISGLQHAGKSASTDEFIELANQSASPISLTGWQIQYRAASATNGTDCAKGWTTKATIASGTIAPGGQYLLAPTIFMPADTSFSAGLAAAGTVRVINPAKASQDALAWGAASCGQGSPAASPPVGQSLERRSGADGSHNDNATDFFIQSHPAASALAYGVTTADAAGVAGTDDLYINELLVDPAAPQSDSDDNS